MTEQRKSETEGILSSVYLHKTMRICFLSSMHTPYDKRVFGKEAVSLAGAGFDVVHIAPGNGPSAQERGVQVLTYTPPQGLFDRIFQLRRLYQLAAKVNANIYHCNEVDSWLVGIFLKLMYGKKIVFDVHEHYPSTFAESRFPPVLRPFVAGVIRLAFRGFLPFTDRIVLAKRSVAQDFRGAESKQVLVQNFTSMAYANARRRSVPSCRLPNAKQTIIAIHLGLISRQRGWPQLLAGVAQAKSKDLHLHIVGTFNDGSQADFENQTFALGLENRVQMEEWLPFEQAFQRILAAQIGIILFQPGIQNHVFALPHKMFDYMLAGLPVIAPSFAQEVSFIIRERECGILLDPSNPSEIAEAFDRLVSNAHERRQLGENGRRAVFDRYNWETEAEKLIDMYSEMVGEV